jgi:hypothetical protein
MREARVNASMQRMFLAQSLPDAMTDQFWDLREDERNLDENSGLLLRVIQG